MSLIAGIILNNTDVNISNLDRDFSAMSASMLHRGNCTVSDIKNGKYFIIQKSFESYDLHFDNIEIVFDGCIYNKKEIIAELKAKFQNLPSLEREEELIVFCYKKMGLDCLNIFEGKWAFCLVDKLANLIILSRDRFGLKPLYYCNFNSKLYFASEIKAFTKIIDFKAKANIARVFDFLVYQEMSYCKETMFENIYQVLHGQNLILNLEDFSLKAIKWYELDNIKNTNDIQKNDCDKNLKPEYISEQIKQFRKLLDEAVESRYLYNQNTASCLSGGIDSSAIVCSLYDNKNFKEISTVSACFSDEKYGEEKYIDIVVNKLGLNAKKVTPDFNELIDNLDKYIYNHDEPFLTTSVFSQIKVFECAKNNGFNALLDGQGADEFLAGYTPFTHFIYFMELKKNRRFALLEKEMNAFAEKYKFSGNLKNILKKYAILNAIPNFLYRKIKEKTNLKNAFYLTKKCINDKQFSKINIKHYTLKKFGKFMLDYSSMRLEFQYEDRSSMYSSVEFHSPFSSHKIIEFLYNLPNDLKIHDGVAKYILREAVKDTLPNKIYTRYSKIGFETPEGEWIKQNCKKFRALLINSLTYLQKIIDTDKVLTCFDNTLSQNKDFNHEFWKLVCLGQWVKVYNVQI